MDRPKIFTRVDEVSDADQISRRSLTDVLHSRDEPLSLFTPALLVTHGGFDRDPVTEFDARFPADTRDLRPFYTELQREHEFFFRGLGAVALPGHTRAVMWDKRLYCVAAKRAEECFAFIGGIAFSNPKTGLFASVFSYDLSIPDPTSVLGQRLQVKVFGVVANSFVVFLEDNGIKQPKVRRIGFNTSEQALGFIRQQGLFTSFTGDDPLKTRDQ